MLEGDKTARDPSDGSEAAEGSSGSRAARRRERRRKRRRGSSSSSGGLVNGFRLFKQGLRTLFRHPGLLVPLLLCWLVYAPLVVYLRFYFPWDRFDLYEVVAVCFGVVLLVSFLLGLSCFVMLEIVEQLETDGRASLPRAFAHAVGSNLVRGAPILFLWAVLWLIVLLLQALFSRRRRSSGGRASPESVARALSGGGPSSLFGLSLSMLNKGIRMAVFLILPAVAWEGCGPLAGTKRGLGVMRTHLAEFATGFVLSGLAAVVVFLPPLILGRLEVELPDSVWVGVIIYCAFAWSLVMYIEQMFAAELYLWHLKWRRLCETRAEGDELPTLADVPRPSLLDDVWEFADA